MERAWFGFFEDLASSTSEDPWGRLKFFPDGVPAFALGGWGESCPLPVLAGSGGLDPAPSTMALPVPGWESSGERLPGRDDEFPRVPCLGTGVLGTPRTLAGPFERVFIEFSLVVSTRRFLSSPFRGDGEAEDDVPEEVRSLSPRPCLRARLRFLGDMSHCTRRKSCDC